MSFVLILTAAAAGYVASVFTWPRLRQALVGAARQGSRARNQIARLRWTGAILPAR
jgi:hypothetical protein